MALVEDYKNRPNGGHSDGPVELARTENPPRLGPARDMVLVFGAWIASWAVVIVALSTLSKFL